MSARRTVGSAFQPLDIPGCLRVDLTRPLNGEAFASGEVGRRIHRAVVGMPADVTGPVDVRVQVVAPDAPTLVAWRSAIAETRS